MQLALNRGAQNTLQFLIPTATAVLGWLSVEAAHAYKGLTGISEGWGRGLSVVALVLIFVGSLALWALQAAERRHVEVKQVDRRNSDAQVHAATFRHYAKLVGNGELSSGLDGFIERLLTELVKQLDFERKMEVRACYYVQEVYEEDEGLDDNMPEYLQYVCTSASSGSPRMQFSTEDQVGRYVIGALRQGKHLQFPDVKAPEVPEVIRNDPLYRDRPRKYRGFLSLPVCDPSRAGNARLLGMLTVDFVNTDRATDSDLKLVQSYENVLTSALIAAQSAKSMKPQSPLTGSEG